MEGVDARLRRLGERQTWGGVPGEQVNDGGNAAQQSHNAVGVFGRIIHAIEQDVLEENALGALERKLTANANQVVEAVFPSNGHDAFALFLS